MLTVPLLLYWLLASGRIVGTLHVDEAQDRFEIWQDAKRTAWGNTEGLDAALSRLGVDQVKRVKQR